MLYDSEIFFVVVVAPVLLESCKNRKRKRLNAYAGRVRANNITDTKAVIRPIYDHYGRCS
jgi:hypothetical protein